MPIEEIEQDFPGKDRKVISMSNFKAFPHPLPDWRLTRIAAVITSAAPVDAYRTL
jgi:hypothetical protein